MQSIVIPDELELLAAFTIYGKVPRKSNARRIVRPKGLDRPLVIKSQQALDYVKAFIQQVPAESKQGYGSIQSPLLLIVKAYYPSWRSDLSVEIIKDALEDAGVISNDRYIRADLAFAYIDKVNPRAEIYLFSFSGYDRDKPLDVYQGDNNGVVLR
jgi:hypothetical protein